LPSGRAAEERPATRLTAIKTTTPNPETTMKTITTIIFPTLAAVILSACGESDTERAQRQEAERDRQILLEYQRQENIQRQRDRDQRSFETGVEVLDILTR
jgi:hypothetical protein